MAIETEYTHGADQPTIENIVVLLHGYGADGKDLIDLAKEWEFGLPRTLFVAPNAPTTCEQNPFGYQWFSLLSWDEDRMIKGLKEAHLDLGPYLDKLSKTYGVPSNRMVLMGFSQGAMLTLHEGIYGSMDFKGLMAFSGAFFPSDTKPLHTPDVLLAHGDRDLVVPLSGTLGAEDALKAMGVKVETVISQGLGHGIDHKMIKAGQEFLQKCFTRETIENGKQKREA